MQDIFWESIEGEGFEHLKVIKQKDLLYFDSIIIHKMGDKTFRVFYQLVCDHSWKFRKLEITIEGETKKSLNLNVDKSGLWFDDKGVWYQELNGCLEPDISYTPFTNSLPINRLNLAEGETQKIKVAYINLPELTITPIEQSYKCIKKDAKGSTYLYKNLNSSFEAELKVDADSYVVSYPKSFKKI